MDEGLAEACSQLRLTEDEQITITLEDVVDDYADEKAELSLVGKLLTRKPYNLNHLKNAMLSAWKLTKGVIIRDVGDELFVCEFFSKNDRCRIMADGPWNFDKQLILLEPMSGNMQPNNMTLKLCQVWVRIYNLPMNCRGKAAISKIGTKVGRVLEVDGDKGDSNRYERVRVQLDVSKPIIRGTKVINPLGDICWIPFKYERIQNFCYWCGLLDHLVADCEEKPEETEVSEWPYGPTLRATPRKRNLMGNKSGYNMKNRVGEGIPGSGSPGNSGSFTGTRRVLNLNPKTGVGIAIRDGELVHQNDAGLHEEAELHEITSAINQDVLAEETRGQLDGLVEVCIHQIQSNTTSNTGVNLPDLVGNVKPAAKGVKEGSWTRIKTSRMGGKSEVGSSSKKGMSKRNRSLLQGEDSDNLFSKKVRDGLSERFDNIEISAETDVQSRRMQ
ncbi:uncharacterized protein LOC126657315 [Mercurialis annua]|uniref:uncharacterized protein LOC126657315 n=1 Tax=Mercurialis annua TaxID=3986 RepID=UPI00215DF521|nr:uncharacterized protein LOC126657315 [Mercurialis annua]